MKFVSVRVFVVPLFFAHGEVLENRVLVGVWLAAVSPLAEEALAVFELVVRNGVHPKACQDRLGDAYLVSLTERQSRARVRPSPLNFQLGQQRVFVPLASRRTVIRRTIARERREQELCPAHRETVLLAPSS